MSDTKSDSSRQTSPRLNSPKPDNYQLKGQEPTKEPILSKICKKVKNCTQKAKDFGLMLYRSEFFWWILIPIISIYLVSLVPPHPDLVKKEISNNITEEVIPEVSITNEPIQPDIPIEPITSKDEGITNDVPKTE